VAALLGFVMFAQAVCSGSDMCAEGVQAADEAAVVEEAPVAVVPDCGMPICGALGARLYCIEGLESRHYGGAVNPTSNARGYLQWIGSTARAWGVVPGNRQSEWSTAARMLATSGEAFFRSQWPVTARLCP